MFHQDIELEKIRKVFCIGIGGIGISAAALFLKEMGKEVSGSDFCHSEIIEMLNKKGVQAVIGQRAENITPVIDLVVYSVAVPESHPERLKAAELGLPQISYPQLLGILIRNQFGIGIAGTNGKTTTTAMLGQIFIEAGLDPSMVVGSKVDFLGGNYRVGRGDYFIFESDEHRRAFDNYNPKLAVVTYIAADHLDCFKDLDEIKSAFKNYLQRVPRDGFIVINNDDKNSQEAAKNCPAKVVTFAIDKAADFTANNIRIREGKQSFAVLQGGEVLGEITLKIPARYNVYNALAAISAALTLGVGFEVIKKSLAGFHGVWRRFEHLGSCGKTGIITDYAHTPDAVAKTIQAAKEFFPHKKILAVFQPHQYNRTKRFFDDFAAAFDGADKAILTDIFYVEGRENPKDFNVSSEKLAAAIKARGVAVEYGGDLDQTEKKIREAVGDFSAKGAVPASGWDQILLMGAGDIYEVAKKLAEK